MMMMMTMMLMMVMMIMIMIILVLMALITLPLVFSVLYAFSVKTVTVLFSEKYPRVQILQNSSVLSVVPLPISSPLPRHLFLKENMQVYKVWKIFYDGKRWCEGIFQSEVKLFGVVRILLSSFV